MKECDMYFAYIYIKLITVCVAVYQWPDGDGSMAIETC